MIEKCINIIIIPFFDMQVLFKKVFFSSTFHQVLHLQNESGSGAAASPLQPREVDSNKSKQTQKVQCEKSAPLHFIS